MISNWISIFDSWRILIKKKKILELKLYLNCELNFLGLPLFLNDFGLIIGPGALK
jgi:hypothetical protein